VVSLVRGAEAIELGRVVGLFHVQCRLSG
jgi:hypothetical protein